MSRFITLMYHSVYKTDIEYAEISSEDRPYAIHVDEFTEHVRWVIQNNITVLYPDNLKINTDSDKVNLLFTFDDGHVGFYRYAYPVLKKYNLSAIFFITTDFIGERSEFCSWDQLNDMSLNGMVIQSHGKSHEFLNDMSSEDMHNELEVSKNEIEKHTNSKVFSVSFPGGRFNNETIRISRQLGYTHFFTSHEDSSKISKIMGGCINRYAIRRATTVNELSKFIYPDLQTRVKRLLMIYTKKTLKLLIGNYAYHGLYKFLHTVSKAK